MTDNITALRPKGAKSDPTSAQRQARYRKKRKGIVTVPAISATPAPIAHHSPPPQEGRDIPPVTVPRNGNATIDVAAYTAAVALAAAAAFFSIKGMVVIFPGTPTAVIVMAVAMEAAKLITAGWLARRWRSTAWVWRGILVALVAGLALINAAGVYAQLVSAHVGERGATTSAIETQDAALAARIEVAVHNVADLDRRLNQIDTAIEEAGKRGKTNAALSAIDGQRKARAELSGQRQREGEVLADLKAERAALGAKGKQLETESAPIRYVAELLGTDTDSERAIRWLIALMVLCCDSLAIALTAAASTRRTG
jgi:hypothetical protein